MECIYKNGRDNARTLMQWNADENDGFTKGKPWIQVNSNYTYINAAKEENKDLILNYYKKTN